MNILTKLRAALNYLLYWLIFFLVGKGMFLTFHAREWTDNDLANPASILWHGLPLDLSMLSYVSLLSLLLISLSDILPMRWWSGIIRIYTWFHTVLLALVLVSDLQLYRAWGTHINASAIQYLTDPEEALASMSSSPVLLLVLLFLLYAGAAILLYRVLVDRQMKRVRRGSLFFIPLYLLCTAALVIPIRGGFQLAPINQSSVYFSTDYFANQAAVNPVWNLMHSLSKSSNRDRKTFAYMSEEEAESRFNSFYDTQIEREMVLTMARPNVIFIIWESFTAKVVAELGGRPGVTPEFSKLIPEGILFTHAYSSGDRSDKGLVSILSGYPAQPSSSSIIKQPEKTARLPHLSRDMNSLGYHSAFYYGGELEFANIKSYLLNGQFGKLVGVGEFPEESLNSKWGAHDGVVFDRFLKDLNNAREPFFYSMFTLSSHEPFEVPVETVIEGDDEESRFLNSHHYTDAELGRFITAAKLQPWWDSTLVVIVADHGHPLPGGTPPFDSQKYHIPMLWLGGALAQKGVLVEQYVSQTDIASTLLGQLQVAPAIPYRFSADIFARPDSASFAFFDFNNGFGLLQPNGKVVIDGHSGKPIVEEGQAQEESAKAYLQVLMGDYWER